MTNKIAQNTFSVFMKGLVTKGLCGAYKDCSTLFNVHAKVRDDGGVEFINEGRGARLRIFAALKHRFLKQVLCRSQTSHIPSKQTHSCRRSMRNLPGRLPSAPVASELFCCMS